MRLTPCGGHQNFESELEGLQELGSLGIYLWTHSRSHVAQRDAACHQRPKTWTWQGDLEEGPLPAARMSWYREKSKINMIGYLKSSSRKAPGDWGRSCFWTPRLSCLCRMLLPWHEPECGDQEENFNIDSHLIQFSSTRR